MSMYCNFFFRSIALSGVYNTIDTYFKTNGDVLFTNLKITLKYSVADFHLFKLYFLHDKCKFTKMNTNKTVYKGVPI